MAWSWNDRRELIYLDWRDRKHWTIDVWRFCLLRWCNGAPCHLPGVNDKGHRILAGYQRSGYQR